MMLERYQRHNLIDWFSQDTLTRTKAAVIGAGAVGNEVIKNLAILGVGEIHVFDFDTIEEHNLTRSVMFRTEHVGRSKALVAAEQASLMDCNISVVGTHGDFWDHLKLLELQTYDVLFCCVDNFEARIRCNTLCYLTRVDFVNTGIDSRFAVAEVFPFSRVSSGCFECNIPPSVYSGISERYSCGHLRKLTFIEKKVPTTIITSTIAASIAVSAGLRLGALDAEPAARRLYVDTIGGSLTNTLLTQASDCPCCGQYGNNLALVAARPDIEALPTEWDPDATVTTSEPILVSYRIGGHETLIFDRASRFDSDFPATVAEDPGDVELEVRDQFTLSELASRFKGRAMPCKYAVVTSGEKTVVFEFTERQS